MVAAPRVIVRLIAGPVLLASVRWLDDGMFRGTAKCLRAFRWGSLCKSTASWVDWPLVNHNALKMVCAWRRGRTSWLCYKTVV